MQTLLTRKNSVTGIEYRNDPTIFAWELINEPRCSSDVSGNTLQVSPEHFHLLAITFSDCLLIPQNYQCVVLVQSQDWIDEMTSFIKSIDNKHLLTVGLEGFYGPNSPKRLTVNPEQWPSELGTDFVRNSNSSNIDFASVHIYPDHWLVRL